MTTNTSAWTRYLVAASGTALAASSASAAVVYWNPADHQADVGQSFSFDILTGTVTVSGGSSASAFQVSNHDSDYVELVSTASLSNPVVGGNRMARLSSGATIDGSSPFGGGTFVYFDYENDSGYPWNTGVDGTTGYIGLRFAISGQTHYGWAQFTYNDVSNNIILRDFAYQDVAGAAIVAGASAIPEPASATLLLALAAGSVATYRRRRAA